MYDREYDDNIFTFEASGGLINASLVMQDFETDTYWSIITHEAIEGKFKGTKLKELTVSEKVQWKEWVTRYPNTLVLSVGGEEDTSVSYVSYFNSPRGFRGIKADDGRLSDKEPVFTFEFDKKMYAVPNEYLEGGKTYDLGKIQIFLYRPEGAAVFYSTLAFISGGKGFRLEKDKWVDTESECVFDPETGVFIDGEKNCPQRLNGYDTFWYIWSLTNPNTMLLE